MERGRGTTLFQAISWLVLPIIPVLLESFHYPLANLEFGPHAPADPYDWNTYVWFGVLGPLVGFGFLAGATLGEPDDAGISGWRSWRRRRAVWVAVGPWSGFLLLVGLYLGAVLVGWCLEHVLSEAARSRLPSLDSILPNRHWFKVTLTMVLIMIAHYGWLPIAVAALRRPRRRGRSWLAALIRGLLVAASFLASLLGSFWAATANWRSYFFDPTIVSSLLIGFVALVVLPGCTSTYTAGELRRRELFQAMLLAWVFGLALAWLWWSRRKR